MSSCIPNIATTEPTATVPLSTNFCADDADVIIRAAGTLDFRVHKFILSLVSPIFKDMFTLPQPPPDIPGTLPCVDVQDPAGTWEMILRTIYHPILPIPTIDTFDDLESLLFAARAYEMQSVIEAHKKVFERRVFIETDPLRLYLIACAYGFEDQATHIARNAELVTVTRRPDPSDLRGFKFGAYHRLVSFLVDRDNEWSRTLEAVQVSECDASFCTLPQHSAASLYNEIKKHLRQPCLQTEEVYLKALESRRKSGCHTWCPFGNTKIKEFIQVWIQEREKVWNKFQPAQWYCSHEKGKEDTSIRFVNESEDLLCFSQAQHVLPEFNSADL